MMTDHFLKKFFDKKKNKIVFIEIIYILFFIASGFLPYKINAFFGTYTIGFNLISLPLVLVTILFLFFIVSTYFENYLSTILFSFSGCSIIGVILLKDLIFVSSPEFLGIGFYFAYFPWLCLCLTSIFLLKSRIKLQKSNLYKTLNEYERDHLSRLKVFYLFSLTVFYILISLPFVEYRPFIYGSGAFFFILGGGWIGIALLVISYIYTSIFQIQKSAIIGLIGNFLIGLNLILVIFAWAESLTAAYLLSFLVWIFIFSINISQIMFLFHKYRFPRKKIINLNWNKSTIKLLKWVNVFYLICTIGFITTTLFPYSPFSPAYDLNKVGLYYLWMGGWQGLFLIILSIIFLYYLKLRITYTLGIIGSILIGINFIVLLIFIFVDDQQTFLISFYISVSLLTILFIINIILFAFHFKNQELIRIR
jgi:hypothetical protein